MAGYFAVEGGGEKYRFAPAALCDGDAPQPAAVLRVLLDAPAVRKQLRRLARDPPESPCLCALATSSRAVAAAVSEEIAFAVRHCGGSYAGTAAHVRMAHALEGGPPCPEHAGGYGVPRRVDDACRALGAHVCMCGREGRVWFGRTPEDKRLLRRVGRLLHGRGYLLSVRRPTPYEQLAALRPSPLQVVELRRASGERAGDYAPLWGALEDLAKIVCVDARASGGSV